MAAIVVVLPARRSGIACRPGAGLLAAFARRRLPAVHPLDRRADTASRRRSSPCPPRSSPSSGPSEQRAPASGLAGCPGFLFGLTALFRPEYLLVGVAFVVLAAIRVGRARGWRPGLAAAGAAARRPAPADRALDGPQHVVLDRAVPISTGGGKALYVGTYLPADGEYQRVKAMLVERYQHRDLDAALQALEEVNPTPLFDRVAERYPDLPRDSALGKIGKQNFSKYFGEDPVGYLAMTARKVGRMWSSGVGEAMGSTAGRVDPDPDRRARRWPASSCSACGAAGGSWSRWRRRSRSSPRSAPSRWRPRGATRC